MRLKKQENATGMIEISSFKKDEIQIIVDEEGCVFLINEFQELLKNKKFITEYPQNMGYYVGVLTAKSLGLFIARIDVDDCCQMMEKEQDLGRIEVSRLSDSSVQIVTDKIGCEHLINELYFLQNDKSYKIKISRNFNHNTTKGSLGLIIVNKSIE